MKKFFNICNAAALIFLASQSSFGMNNDDLHALLRQKITYEDLDNLHEHMKRGFSIKDLATRLYVPTIYCDPLVQRIKFECSEWCFIFIKNEKLRDKVGATLEDLLTDLVLPFDFSIGSIAKMYADRHREARLAEQNPRCIENLIIETCLMDLLEWASRERNRDYFFQLKEAFTAWMFDLQSLGEGYDLQKQLENRKGFFRKLFGF